MAIPLKRDSQQWVFDYVVQESGRPQHFQGGQRLGLPATVHQHDMISKHYGRLGSRVAQIADEEYDAGHVSTALDLFFDAAALFAQAQHPVFENNREKRELHAASIGCYDRVRELAPYPIEHLEIPWEGKSIFANLHLLNDRRKAPCVIFLPGCDMTKELYPHPTTNHAHQRGMHILSLDGPGQGECNLNGVVMTADNYERAVGAVVEYLVSRPEIDSDAILLFGLSFASFWAVRSATDPRIRALAAPWASICDKKYLMERESPRFKKLFSFMTQAGSEEELDATMAEMSIEKELREIRCPTLFTVGEYDPRSPLEEVLALYKTVTCEKEIWVFEDQHHSNVVAGHAANFDTQLWNMDTFMVTLDWLADRVAGRPLRHPGAVTYVQSGRGGPNGATVRVDGSWLDSLPFLANLSKG